MEKSNEPHSHTPRAKWRFHRDTASHPSQHFGHGRGGDSGSKNDRTVGFDSFVFEGGRRNSNKKMFPFMTPLQTYKKKIDEPELKAPPIAHDTLRIVPFGGLEQVGLNCIGFEYEDEVLIVDMGLQFSDQYQFGISSSIPDLSYLKHKKIVGIAITHGHIDHIGAIPFLMRQLGKNIPMFATPMAYELIKFKQSEVDYVLPRLQTYTRGMPVSIGKYFTVTPFTVDHSIPDSVGILIDTPVGSFIHTGDWKFDKNPLPNRPSTDYALLESYGNRGIRALLSDSTNAYISGSSISESEVIGSIEEIFSKAEGRIITATFSSIIDRVMVIISAAEKFNRKVVLLGRGMNNYMDIAIKLGYARPKPGTLISMKEADGLPDDRVTICCTGAQGERYAALTRITTGESPDTSLKATDTVVFSSSVIPGNERSVQGLYDLIASQWPRIFHYKESEIHAGGHARAEDTKKMISLIRPQVYIPIYGFPYMLHGNAKNATDLGITDDRIIIGRNGRIIEFTHTDFRLTPYYVSHRLITVDGRMIGYTNDRTLHDRYQLSTSGVMVLSIAKKTGKYLISIETSGLPDTTDLPFLSKKIVDFLQLVLEADISRFTDIDHLKKFVTKKVADMVFDEIAKEPIIIVLTH